MARTVGIGYQDFADLIQAQNFYIDKTRFLKEWWENKDMVTLITRPRRFGKTLTMSMTECFFSVEYADRRDIFEDLAIFQDESYRKLQGTWPVISLSFAEVKETTFEQARKKICQLIENLYSRFDFLLKSDLLNAKEKDFFNKVSVEMEDYTAALSVKSLSEYLSRYYNKKVIILLDEYDTPMQEAYIQGYWEKMVEFLRGMFNSAFKTNPYLERAIMTGITRVSKESVFSDLNNLVVVTTTSRLYRDSFGFTEEEVFQALEEYGLSAQRKQVKDWYDGFTFGGLKDIYNPWSILSYLKEKRLNAYWANTSSNSLVGKRLRSGDAQTKIIFEQLLKGEILETAIDEQVVYNQLDQSESAIWSLLLASGYLKVLKHELNLETGEELYQLALTNKEVRIMFCRMIHDWFGVTEGKYNEFIRALLVGDKKAMNSYMNKIALSTFSYFDTGKRPSEDWEPERFYHGFVLGLIVDLGEEYEILSNRESGFGRYDVMLIPKKENMDGIILEFKVMDPDEEATLADTVASAVKQIEEKQYSAQLISSGVPKDRIRCLGFAFEGKKVLIG